MKGPAEAGPVCPDRTRDCRIPVARAQITAARAVVSHVAPRFNLCLALARGSTSVSASSPCSSVILLVTRPHQKWPEFPSRNTSSAD